MRMQGTYAGEVCIGALICYLVFYKAIGGATGGRFFEV